MMASCCLEGVFGSFHRGTTIQFTPRSVKDGVPSGGGLSTPGMVVFDLTYNEQWVDQNDAALAALCSSIPKSTRVIMTCPCYTSCPSVHSQAPWDGPCTTETRVKALFGAGAPAGADAALPPGGTKRKRSGSEAADVDGDAPAAKRFA